MFWRIRSVSTSGSNASSSHDSLPNFWMFCCPIVIFSHSTTEENCKVILQVFWVNAHDRAVEYRSAWQPPAYPYRGWSNRDCTQALC
jgi:hypothetical protein